MTKKSDKGKSDKAATSKSKTIGEKNVNKKSEKKKNGKKKHVEEEEEIVHEPVVVKQENIDDDGDEDYDDDEDEDYDDEEDGPFLLGGGMPPGMMEAMFMHHQMQSGGMAMPPGMMNPAIMGAMLRQMAHNHGDDDDDEEEESLEHQLFHIVESSDLNGAQEFLSNNPTVKLPECNCHGVSLISAIIKLQDKNIALQMAKLILERLDDAEKTLPNLFNIKSPTNFGDLLPLQEACVFGKIELCNYFIGKINEMPSKFNYQVTTNKEGFPKFSLLSLLVFASRIGNTGTDGPRCVDIDINDEINLINRIIQSGCNKEIRDSFGRTLLHHAVSFRNINFVERILAESFDLNAVDNDGYNLYHSYVTGPSIKTQSYAEIDSTIKLLLRYGLNINSFDNDGLTAFCKAFTEKCSETTAEAIFRAFLNNGAYPTLTAAPVPVIHIACRIKSVTIVELFRQHGCSLDTISHGNGESVLFAATAGANLPVIEYLVNAGLDIDAVDNDNDTCLHLAAALQNPAARKATVDLLVRLGANQNLRNKIGYKYKELLPTSADHGGRGRHDGHGGHGGGMVPGMAQCPIS